MTVVTPVRTENEEYVLVLLRSPRQSLLDIGARVQVRRIDNLGGGQGLLQFGGIAALRR